MFLLKTKPLDRVGGAITGQISENVVYFTQINLCQLVLYKKREATIAKIHTT